MSGTPIEVVRPGDPWPPAVSDGLTLPCAGCGEVPRFDCHVSDATWQRVVPPEHRLGVVCLPCLDRMASALGICIGPLLEFVQFTGNGHTVCLRPERVVRYGRLTDG